MNSVVQALRNHLQKRFQAMVDKRSPEKSIHHLGNKNLYIFPTKKGFVFLLFVLVLWLLGTNYQNNLILGLTFMLISMFIVSILHTFANLSGIFVELKGASNAYKGDAVEFFVELKNDRSRIADGVRIRWQDHDELSDFICVPKHDIATGVALLKGIRRGVLKPRRLLVESEYPLGLLRCWTWLRFDAHALVYPKPLEFELKHTAIADEGGDGEHPVKGGEDFSALHEYRAGDPIKHVAWKLYARERGLFTKEFSQSLSKEIWLDFFQVNTTDTEEKLSALCFWALVFHQKDEHYGLLLPGVKIEPNKGENHKAKILEALACFNA